MDRLTAMHAYVRLVELGSFSGVAQELRVKQSTVSKWMAALEDELGAQLVERTTRTQRVTDAGQRFYARAKDIVAAYDGAAAELAATTPRPRGRLRVTVPVVFGRLFVIPHLAKFMRKHAEVEVELTMSDRYANLVDEGFDVAIRVGRPVDSSFRQRKLGQTARHLVASPGYLAKHDAPSEPRELREHECLLHTGLTAGDTWVFRRAAKAVRAPVRGRFSANNSEALLTMAKAGLGVAVLASWLVEADLRRGRLVELLPEYDLPPAPVHGLMPPGRFTPPRVDAFLQAMAEALGC